jgi:hypothetical protein
MKTLSLEQAVVLCASKLKIDFSAHDITRDLRIRVGKGEFEVVGAMKTRIGGQETQVILHDEVRSTVDTVSVQQAWLVAPGRKGGQDFRLFQISSVGTGGAGGSVIHHDDAWKEKAETYVVNKHSEGVYPTLRAVQSRLKGWSVPLADIEAQLTPEFTMKELGGRKNWQVMPKV